MRQPLSPKRTAYYARRAGIPFERMLARGGSGHWMLFRTVDHEHGYVRFSKSGFEIEFISDHPYMLLYSVHWSPSCELLYPDDYDVTDRGLDELLTSVPRPAISRHFPREVG